MSVELCRLAELPEGGARGFVLRNVSLLAVRDHRGVYVYLNRCPHLGTPLQWQDEQFLDNEGSFIRCANHGALFEKDTGACILGPCQGDRLWQIECRVENGMVVIDAAELPVRPAL